MSYPILFRFGSKTWAWPEMATSPECCFSSLVSQIKTLTRLRTFTTSILASSISSKYTGKWNFSVWSTYTEPGSETPNMVGNKLAHNRPCTIGALYRLLFAKSVGKWSGFVSPDKWAKVATSSAVNRRMSWAVAPSDGKCPTGVYGKNRVRIQSRRQYWHVIENHARWSSCIPGIVYP